VDLQLGRVAIAIEEDARPQVEVGGAENVEAVTGRVGEIQVDTVPSDARLLPFSCRIDCGSRPP
jgi:hypothetical protein